MNKRKKLNEKRKRRAVRAAARITGTAARPRLTVHRTNRHFYAQLIDDVKGVTLLAVSSMAKGTTASKGPQNSKSTEAARLGELLGKKAVEKAIKSAVFDRRSYRFHGRVKSFAEGARKAGLTI